MYSWQKIRKRAVVKSVNLALLVLVWFLLPNSSIGQIAITKNRFHPFFLNMAARNTALDDTVRLYISRQGDIYPPAPYLPDATFETGDYIQSLFQWYDKHPAKFQDLARFCGIDFSPSDSYEVRMEKWERIQDALAARIATYIDRRTENTSGTARRPLVTLIHGYNNEASAKTFYAAENALKSRFSNAVWMLVRWDGLQIPNSINVTRQASVWGAGQLNARLAGVALREVLFRTNPAIPIRIFTHSAGAIVACHALWNASPLNGVEPPDRTHPDEDPITFMRHTPTPTHQDIRLGMMAPAMTPLVFRNYDSLTCQVTDKLLLCKRSATQRIRIVAGQNTRDAVLNKFVGAPYWFGDTEFGCRKDAFDQAVDNCGCRMQRVDFSTATGNNPSLPKFQFSRILPKAERHDWGLYWLRPKAAEFIDMVLN